MANPTLDTLTGEGGHFRVFVTPPGSHAIDLTFFRDVPTQVAQFSTTDPFGDATASINFPAITSFDRPGQGDLFWLVPWADVDIYYFNADGSGTDWRWEGMIVSEEVGKDYSVSLVGALHQADNFLASPIFPQYPIPYETLISDKLNPVTHPTLHTQALRVVFPDDWATVVPDFTSPSYLWFLRPWGVVPGQKWTGLTTRTTGAWEPVLTGFIQTMLSVMYTDDGGQWTIMKDTGRAPVMKVRKFLTAPNAQTLEVWNGAPGVEMNFSRDFSQSTNVVYGAGTDLNGAAYSGQQVTVDGQTTYYDPFAALPQVYPSTSSNARLLPTIVRKESRLQFPDGLDQVSARDVAATQLRRFADPGYVGTVTLTSDPLQAGQAFSRILIQAGMSILVHNLRGADVLFHISQVEVDPTNLSTNLTVDSKFRDSLTVAEVKARTRDALDPIRLLQIGKFSTTVQDQIKPWSYSDGSGVLPSGGAQDASPLFKLMAPNEIFPWTNFTTAYPPSKYPKYYVHIGPKNANANNNWAALLRDKINLAGIPIKMAQSGQIRLTQVAAYDKDGHVLPVRFHLSLYGSSGINVISMPSIPAAQAGTYGYPAAQHYPFFPEAFEQIKPDGTQQNLPSVLLAEGSDLIIGWGTFFEGAGYYPGKSSNGGVKTGLLVDEASWTFDTSNQPGFDKYSVANTQKDPTAGMIYAMIYCDDQAAQDVYFLGRMFVQAAGAT